PTGSRHPSKCRAVEQGSNPRSSPPCFRRFIKTYSAASLTAVNLLGERPDEGKFPVRPSSLTPSAVRRRATPKAGVTMFSEGKGQDIWLPPVVASLEG